MEWYVGLSIIFVVLLLVMLTGLPIAFSLSLLGIVAILLFWPEGRGVIGTIALRSSLSFVLVAIPVFILMGEILQFSGLSTKIFDMAQKWLGALPGSLAIGAVITGTVFAALTGSNTANQAIVGTVSIPEMLKRGYNRRLAFGAAGGGGALGILIPPSIAMILYGSLSETNVAQLFIAGVIPGLVISALLILYVIVSCVRHPDWAPTLNQGQIRWQDRMVSLKNIWPVLFLILLVLGTIYLGVATPTEAAAIGCLGSIFLGFIYKSMSWSHLRAAFLATTRVTSMIMLILVGGILFSKVLTIMGLANQLVTFLTTLPVSRWLVMIGIQILILILGCIMDSGSIIIVFTPLLAPVARALGFDPVWFGILFTINIEVGCLTPPVGYNLFVLKGIVPEVPMEEIIRGVMPFIVMYLVGMALVMIFPQLSLWLPGKMS